MREVVGAQNLKINILTVPDESMASFRVPYSREALAKVVSCAILGDTTRLRRTAVLCSRPLTTKTCDHQGLSYALIDKIDAPDAVKRILCSKVNEW